MNQYLKSHVYWKLLLLAYFSLLCHAAIENSRGPSYPRILEFFQVDSDRGSLIFALGIFFGFLVNLSSRWWLPRFGALKALKYSSFFMFIGVFFYFLFPWMNKDFDYLILASCILGIGTSGSAIPMNLLAAKATSLNLRRRALAGLHAVYGLTSLCAPFLFSIWISQGQSWFSFFFIISFLPLILYFMTFQKFKPIGAYHELSDMTPPATYGVRFLVGLTFALYVSGELLVSTRLVYFLQTTTTLEREVTERSLSLFFLCLTIGRLVFAFVDLPVSNIKALVLSITFSIVFMILGLTYNVWFIPISGLSMSFFFPVAVDWLGEKFEKGLDFMTASMFTWVNFFLMFMHYGFGMLTEKTNVQTAFWLSPICLVLSLALLLFLDFFILKQKDLISSLPESGSSAHDL